MVLVRGPWSLRDEVEHWIEVHHRVTVEAEAWEIFPATLYRVGAGASPAGPGAAQRLHEALLRPGVAARAREADVALVAEMAP
eukprot:5712763-Alexandrium_andersonii.AAC.1